MCMSWESTGPTVAQLLAANKAIAEAKATSDVCVRILPIPVQSVCWCVVSDAALANATSQKSQGGFLVAATTQSMLDGQLAPFSVLIWKSHRLKRVVKASLGAEALSLDDGLAECEWARALWYEFMSRGASLSSASLFGAAETVVVIRAPEGSAETCVVTDARGLHDMLVRKSGSAKGLCRRAQLDVAVMGHSLRSLNGQVHWVPGEVMVADALTKRNGNGALLRSVLRVACYGVTAHAIHELLTLVGMESGPVSKTQAKLQRRMEVTA